MRAERGGLDGREASRRAERGQQLLAVSAAHAGRLARARRRGELARGDVDVGAEAGERRLAAGDAILQRRAQRLEAVAGARRRGEHGDVAEALRGEQPRQVLARPPGVLAEPVALVEHDEHRGGVPGERSQIAIVQRGVGVLLRVDHPHEQVDEAHEPVHLDPMGDLDRVEVGQVEQDQPVRAAAVERVPRRHLQPVEQPVVGRAEDGGARRRGGRPRDALADERATRERVEQGGLPRPRRSGERDHRRLEAVPETLAGAADHRPRGLHGARFEPVPGQLHGVREGREPGLQRAAHRARSSAAAAASSRPSPVSAGAAAESRAS